MVGIINLREVSHPLPSVNLTYPFLFFFLFFFVIFPGSVTHRRQVNLRDDGVFGGAAATVVLHGDGQQHHHVRQKQHEAADKRRSMYGRTDARI